MSRFPRKIRRLLDFECSAYLELYKTGRTEMRTELCEHFLPIIFSIAQKKARPEELEDLFNACVVQFLEFCDSYKPKEGVSFKTMVVARLKWFCLDVRDEKLIRLPRNSFREIIKTRSSFTQASAANIRGFRRAEIVDKPIDKTQCCLPDDSNVFCKLEKDDFDKAFARGELQLREHIPFHILAYIIMSFEGFITLVKVRKLFGISKRVMLRYSNLFREVMCEQLVEFNC